GLLHRQQPEVVHGRQAAGVLPATGQCDLELTPEVLRVGMAEQEAHDRLRVRRDVERLVAAHAGKRAGGDVADGVAARFAGRDTDCGEAAHDVGRVVDVDVVELKVLAGGDVTDGVGVFFGEVGEHLHLFWVQPAGGGLDALHAGCIPEGVGSLQQATRRVVERAGGDAVVALTVVVALAVGAAAQAGFGEDLVLDLALLLQLDLGLEDVDFTAPLGRYAFTQLLFPGRGHGSIPRASQPAPRCVRAGRGGAH